MVRQMEDMPVYEVGRSEPAGYVEQGPVLREKTTDSWFRELHDGRVEIMCRCPGYRIRVTAPEDEAWEAVEMFERWTGVNIRSDRRPPRRVPAPPGQLDMLELESGGNHAEN